MSTLYSKKLSSLSDITNPEQYKMHLQHEQEGGEASHGISA